MKPLALRYPPQGTLPAGVLDVSADGESGVRTRAEWNEEAGPPVVCLHGTVASGGNWANLAMELLARGRVVVAPTYGERGTRPVRDNLAEVTGIVRRTLEATGAAQVDVVGHSQGGLLAGLMVAAMLREEPGALPPGAIRRVACISGGHRGVRGHGLPRKLVGATFGPALADQMELARTLRRTGGEPEVARAVRDAGSAPLPDWFDLVTDADRIIPAGSALTPDEYPGARTVRLEDVLGRGVPHQLQPHDRGIAEFVAELLA